jgi:hypothetical protein
MCILHYIVYIFHPTYHASIVSLCLDLDSYFIFMIYIIVFYILHILHTLLRFACIFMIHIPHIDHVRMKI